MAKEPIIVYLKLRDTNARVGLLMELLFREVRPDEVEQELTQKDQFNTDRVPLAATLVRESLQNSTDARKDNVPSPVKIRIAFTNINADNKKFWKSLLGPLKVHLDACGLGIGAISFDTIDFLVIEDFGTTGLTGNYREKDEGNFSDFWRRVGRSHKGSTKGAGTTKRPGGNSNGYDGHIRDAIRIRPQHAAAQGCHRLNHRHCHRMV